MTRTLIVALVVATQTPKQIFRFETDGFWLNLHHFLYVLGRAEAGIADSRREAVAGAPADHAAGLKELSESEQAAWKSAVTFYARSWSRKDTVFDADLVEITNQLKRAPSDQPASTRKIDPAVAAVLDRAAPMYRKVWWPRHRDANRAWLAALQPLLKQYGSQILSRITALYQLSWTKDGYPIQISAWGNWAGAYSTSFSLLVVSSFSPSNVGTQGLESVFHESMHQWDQQIDSKLAALAKANGTKPVNDDLSHAILFYTIGEVVRDIVPGHRPMADVSGIWNRGLGAFKPALEKYWQPYLDGKVTMNEALIALLKS
jgi:hypothetical protein